MTCAQGLLRLLWGGPEVGVLRDWADSFSTAKRKFWLEFLVNDSNDHVVEHFE